MAQILLVEDEVMIAAVMKSDLVRDNHDVTLAHTVEDAHKALEGDNAYDCVLLDFRLGQTNSKSIAEVLCKRKTPFALVSGNIEEACATIACKPKAVLSKPFRPDTLREIVTEMTSSA